jgi:hypothetical protein
MITDKVCEALSGWRQYRCCQRANPPNHAVPCLCAPQGIEPTDIVKQEAKFGVDLVYRKHFAVTAEFRNGKHSTERFVGTSGRRLRRGNMSTKS